MRKPNSEALITSRDNPLVKQFLAVARRRHPGLVLVEGPRAIREAELAGREIERLVLREGSSPPTTGARASVVSRQVFAAMSETETPQGALALVRAAYVSLDEARARAGAAGWPLVVLDGVQDPGNVGTIARTAAAAGAPSVVLLPGTAEAFSPKAVRASAGNVFRVALAKAGWPELEELRCCGADPRARTSLYEARLDSADAVVFGGEAHGLRGRRLERFAIPSSPDVESLNVSAAAAIVLFEIRRRRR